MRNFNLDHLQTLIAIADLGNFAAAAQALHLAPPTISLHIKELESRLQADLVVRGRRQAELTPAGIRVMALSLRLSSVPGSRFSGTVSPASKLRAFLSCITSVW